jgi:hypothetical protein
MRDGADVNRSDFKVCLSSFSVEYSDFKLSPSARDAVVSMAMTLQETLEIEAAIRRNLAIETLWLGWDQVQLSNAWLVAGCLAQTVWNARFGLPAAHGISDIDLVYHDPSDLSEEAEQEHAERIRQAFPEIDLWIDVKNEARVHMWYASKFGYTIPPYTTVFDAIDTFPTTATSVGIRPTKEGREVYAPFGLDDLMYGVVRPNKAQITQEIYDAKVARWLQMWPDLTVVAWDA